MQTKIIHTSEDKFYRIKEIEDEFYLLEDLKGDLFNPEINTNISEDLLKKSELCFEEYVKTYGVYGYELEKWNPQPNCGWEHVDSCWGFVGQYDENSKKHNHYIVEELKGQIK